MTRAAFRVSSVFGWAALLVTSLASAEPTAGQQAAAEALFEQAVALVDAGRLAEACDKFAASEQLDPGLGTLLHLADCYDRVGRSASAWALFLEVEERSRRAKQPDRERIASERAKALEGKLSKLELHVSTAHQVPGLELMVAGSPVPNASWNVPLPVDPGKVRIEARAPGRRPWSTQIDVPEGPASLTAEVPELARAPVAKTSQPKPEGPSPPEGSSFRTLGLLTGGVGLAAIAVGGFFGYRAYSLNHDSKAECRTDAPNACTSRGTSLRQDAQFAAKVSTIATISGAVLAVGGVTLIVSAPSPVERASADGRRADRGEYSLQLRGVW